jgi:hypothetical protein
MSVILRLLLILILTASATAVHAAEAEAEHEIIVADSRADRYEIQTDQSEIRVLVYRAGLLGGLGHNHVISCNSLRGDIWLGPAAETASFEFSFPVASLVVDDPQMRKLEGKDFPGEISEKDIAGTKKNMLGPKLLNAAKFADISIVGEFVVGEYAELDVLTDVTVLGQTHELLIPVSVEISGDTLNASGSIHVSHAELGLTRFTAGFGTLKVADEMQLKYRIVAVRRAGNL